jgi:hypothetical protein
MLVTTNKVGDAEVAAFTQLAREKTGLKLDYEIERRYARIIQTYEDDNRGIFGFIDLTNGNILRADGWTRPNLTIKNPVQGNLFDEDKGAGSINGACIYATAARARPIEVDTTTVQGDRISGYDAATGICWDFRNKGDRALLWDHRKTCPVCSLGARNRDLVLAGRCRSGQRWFWRVSNYSRCLNEEKDATEHGFVDTEDEAWAVMRAAVGRLAQGRPVHVVTSHDTASDGLKKLNEARRAARPPSDAKDTPPVEYLYKWSERFRVIKRTEQRIYYIKKGEDIDEHGEPIENPYHFKSHLDDQVGFITLDKLKPDRHGWCRFYPSLEEWQAERRRIAAKWGNKPVDLAALKAAMAEAHPDRGGSNAAFIEARKAYVEALKASRQRS